MIKQFNKDSKLVNMCYIDKYILKRLVWNFRKNVTVTFAYLFFLGALKDILQHKIGQYKGMKRKMKKKTKQNKTKQNKQKPKNTDKLKIHEKQKY